MSLQWWLPIDERSVLCSVRYPDGSSRAEIWKREEAHERWAEIPRVAQTRARQ